MSVTPGRFWQSGELDVRGRGNIVGDTHTARDGGPQALNPA